MNKKRIIFTIVVLFILGIIYFYLNRTKKFDIELNVGETIIANVAGTNLSYLSKDSDIATVDNNGKIYSINEGVAEIEVKNSKGKTIALYKINVKKRDSINEEASLASIIIDSSIELLSGEVKKLSYSFIPETYKGSLVWISNDENIAIIDSEGNVKGIKEGETQVEISTMDLKVSKSILIKVKKGKDNTIDKESSLKFSRSSIDMGIGEKYDSIFNNQQEIISWSSNNTDVAIVTNGVIESKAIGVATITAKFSDGSYSSIVVYVQNKDELENIEIEKNLEMFVGDFFTATVSVSPATSSKRNLTWSSSNSSVATVVEGVIAAKSVGTTIINVTTANGKSSTCSLIVKEKNEEVVVETISLDKKDASVKKSETLTLKATLLPDNAINKTIYWLSSNVEVAKVSNGIVTGLKGGTAIITATTTNGKKATCLVTITVTEAISISLNTTNLTISSGQKETLIATISPSDTYN